jgi:dTMP kinase
MFISFEGIDGCGKTTQLNILSEHLRALGYEVINIREPGGTDISEKIREILLNSKEEIHSITELLLFESARSHLVNTIIKPAIAANKIVISDRFFDSTTAYQGYGRGLNIATVELFNKMASLEIAPDITFYLDVSLKIAKERSTRKIYDRIENSGNEFFERVIEGFRDLSLKNPDRIVLVDASNEIEVTEKKIFDIIMKFLNK